jgi:hypothetical protein
MKKILLIMSVVFAFTLGRAEAQNDTLAILQNIETNKSTYIGQPLSALTNQLPIQIKYFFPNAPKSANIYKEYFTVIAFNFPYNPSQLHLTYPQLWIYWSTPLNLMSSLSLYNQTKGAWSLTIASYYGSAVISDIKLVTQ